MSNLNLPTTVGSLSVKVTSVEASLAALALNGIISARVATTRRAAKIFLIDFVIFHLLLFN